MAIAARGRADDADSARKLLTKTFVALDPVGPPRLDSAGGQARADTVNLSVSRRNAGDHVPKHRDYQFFTVCWPVWLGKSESQPGPFFLRWPPAAAAFFRHR